MSQIHKMITVGLALVVVAQGGAIAARRNKSHRAQPAPPVAGTEASNGAGSIQPSIDTAGANGQSSGGEPVFELSADVKADAIRFDTRPQTHAHLSGGPDRPDGEIIRTQNMPRDPEPGRTYQNVTIHLYFNSLLEQSRSPLLGPVNSADAPTTRTPSGAAPPSGAAAAPTTQSAKANLKRSTPSTPASKDAIGPVEGPVVPATPEGVGK